MDRSALNRQIKEGTLSGVYVFEGKEEYIKEQTLENIRKSLLPSGFEKLNENVLDGADIDSVYDCAMAMPFMCDKRLVVAMDPAFIYEKKASSKDKGQDGTAAKLSFLENDNPSCVVIIYLRSGSDRTKSKSAIQPIENKVITFDYLNEVELSAWIDSQCAQASASMDTEAKRELIASCGGSMNSIKLELDKLINYKYGFVSITAKDVQSVVTPDTEASVFKMIEALIAGKADQGYSILASMLQNNESCVSILSMITRQIRLMCYAKAMYESGEYSRGDIQRSLELRYDFQLKNILNQVTNLKSDYLENLYKRSVETETSIKSGKIGDRQGLDEMTALLCGTSKGARRNN